MILICTECDAAFMGGESPTSDVCAVCAAVQAWGLGDTEDVAS